MSNRDNQVSFTEAKAEVKAKLNTLFLALKDPIYTEYQHAVTHVKRLYKRTTAHGMHDADQNNAKLHTMLRTELLSLMYFFQSSVSFMEQSFIDDNRVRLGVLTDGLVFVTQPNQHNSLKSEYIKAYTIDELTHLKMKNALAFDKLMIEIEEADYTEHARNYFFYWGGCTFQFPDSTKVTLTTDGSEATIVIKKKPAPNEKNDGHLNSEQIVLEEQPYQLKVAMNGQNDLYLINDLDSSKASANIDDGLKEKIQLVYRLTDNEQQRQEEVKRFIAEANGRELKEGFFAINKAKPAFVGQPAKDNPDADFPAVYLVLLNGDEYTFELLMPYQSNKFVIQVSTTIVFDHEQDGASYQDLVITSAC